MKPETHPQYEQINVTCSCGNKFKTRSSLTQDLDVDVCDQCHPFYTGKQKVLDTEGRVQRFQSRFSGFGSKKAEKSDDK